MNPAGLIISFADVLDVKEILVLLSFILSMEDELMRRFGSDNMKSMMERLGMDDSSQFKVKWFQKL